MAKQQFKIEKLISDLCPDGVESKELDEVCNKIFAGGTPTSTNKYYYDGDIPWLRSGEINFDIIKTITQQFYNSTHSLYKPLIRNEYPNLYDVKIDDNTIKLMNEEEYKKDKKIQRSI